MRVIYRVPDGRMSARYHYDEFGMVLDSKKFDVNWPGPDNLIGYTRLEYDYYTDLNYARARYYKPEIGRFISEDSYRGTLGTPISQNRFTYVENNPVRYIDPSGHNPLVIEGIKWALRGKAAARIGNAVNNFVKGIDLSIPSHFGPIVQPGVVDVRIGGTTSPKIEPHKEVIGRDELAEYFNKQAGIGNFPLNQTGIDIESVGPSDKELQDLLQYLSKINSESTSNLDNLRKDGMPYPKHTHKADRSLPKVGEPNSSVDLLDADGTLIQRRYYGPDGIAQEDIDYDHSNSDGSHTFPHRHTWKNGDRQ